MYNNLVKAYENNWYLALNVAYNHGRRSIAENLTFKDGHEEIEAVLKCSLDDIDSFAYTEIYDAWICGYYSGDDYE